MNNLETHPEQTAVVPTEPDISSGPEIPVTAWGNFVLASHPYAEPWDNERLLQELPESDRDNARQTMDATGIVLRYYRDLSHQVDGSELMTDAVRHSADLIRRARSGIAQPLQALIDTSAILPLEFSERLAHELGHDPSAVVRRSYRPACAGGITGVVDALADPDLRGKRVGVIAAEPLSGVVDRRIFTPSGINIATIFGNDFAYVEFNTGDYELVAAKTLIIPDNGVIRVRPFFTPPDNEAILPPHYEIAPGADVIYSATRSGIFMHYQEPLSDNLAEMDGSATAKFFIRHTPDVIAEVLTAAREQGVEPENVIAHQPSLPVVIGINRKLERMGFSQEIPFLLTDMKRSNSSGATALVVWQYMAQHDMIDPEKPSLLVAPGIGSVITAAVIRPAARR